MTDKEQEHPIGLAQDDEPLPDSVLRVLAEDWAQDRAAEGKVEASVICKRRQSSYG